MDRFSVIQIIDDFLPNEIYDHVNTIVNAKNFPWFFINNISYRNKNDELWNEAFSTTLYSKANGEYKSPGFFHMKDMFEYIETRMNLSIDKLYRVKANLYTTSLNSNALQPHIDEPSQNIITGILFLNDSDGDTILYEQLSNEKTHDSLYEESKRVKYTIRESIKPVKNRFVLFEGNRYHSGSRPSHHKTRININFNWLI